MFKNEVSRPVFSKIMTFFALCLCCVFASVGGASKPEKGGINLYEDSSPEYSAFAKKFVRGEGKNEEFARRIVEFARDGETGAIYTSCRILSGDAKEDFLRDLVKEKYGAAANLLGGELSNKRDSRCIHWYTKAEEWGNLKDTDFRFNFAMALLCYYEKLEQSSHDSLTKAWTLIRDWEKFDMAPYKKDQVKLGDATFKTSEKQECLMIYNFLFDQIKETHDIKLFNEIIDSEVLGLKDAKPGEQATKPAAQAFIAAFENTDFMEILFQRKKTMYFGLSNTKNHEEMTKKLSQELLRSLRDFEKYSEQEKKTIQIVESVVKGNLTGVLQDQNIRELYKKVKGFSIANPTEKHLGEYARRIIYNKAARKALVTPPKNILTESRLGDLDNQTLYEHILAGLKEIYGFDEEESEEEEKPTPSPKKPKKKSTPGLKKGFFNKDPNNSKRPNNSKKKDRGGFGGLTRGFLG